MSEQKLDLILGEIGKIENELSSINKRLDSHEDLITQLIGVVKATNEMITVIQTDVSVLKKDVSVLKDDVTESKSGQNRQDRILETLALHSLEQEAIIRELKRIK
ncbi:hypothetical protein [Paenibacillus sp. FSL K6-2524]|uniref:hypothetical protein n=1 Tax=Paenibacillus sp. FSL K6-2524 TaxID=2954516 RepID=UPI0030FC6875